jgi:multiple sugar transport system permease protein
MSATTETTAADAASTKRRPSGPARLLGAKEPTTTYRQLDQRTKRFVRGSFVTLFAAVLLFVFLLPLLFMLTSSLKSEEQIANGEIPPRSPTEVEIDGETYELLQVDVDGTERELALVKPGRQESIFVDPNEPDVEIAWEGNWRGLEPVWKSGVLGGVLDPITGPIDPKFHNFKDAWESTTPNMGRMILNTFLIAGIGMGGTIISSTLVAYGLSRFRLPYKNLILGSLLATIILPRFVTLIPSYIMFRWAGFIGTIVPLTLPHFFSNAYNVFLLRQFFLTIPKELDEAAAIDGAGPMKTLLTVILPQARGAVLAISLFHFFYAWNDFFEPLVFLAEAPEWKPLSIGLYQFLGIYDTNIPLVLAGAFIAMAIPLLVFLALQRIFLSGIDLSGSVK